MKKAVFLAALLLVNSCSTRGREFARDKVCSNQSLKFLRNPRNAHREAMWSGALERRLAVTYRDMQRCYESFTERNGKEEFNTCLVVGVDEGARGIISASLQMKLSLTKSSWIAPRG